MHKLSIIFYSFRLLATFLHGFLYIARIKFRYPTTNLEVPSTFRFDDINEIKLANDVSIGPYSEIVVLAPNEHSKIAGSLIIGSRVIIGKGANIRAAGGGIYIGEGSMLAQDVSLIGSNHLMEKGFYYIDQAWNSKKVGVNIGKNVWICAGVIILPGVSVGENSIIAAGAVVTRDVPSNEIWGGVPAVCIRVI